MFYCEIEDEFYGLVVPLYEKGWDRLDWDRLHRGCRACPGTGTCLHRGPAACCAQLPCWGGYFAHREQNSPPQMFGEQISNCSLEFHHFTCPPPQFQPSTPSEEIPPFKPTVVPYEIVPAADRFALRELVPIRTGTKHSTVWSTRNCPSRLVQIIPLWSTKIFDLPFESCAGIAPSRTL